MMALKSCASAEAASCSAAGAEGGRKPQRFILLSSCPTLAQSRARVNPHHSGEAYIKDETVVILAISWMAEGGRTCERRTLSAYMEDAQVVSTSSRCCPIPRSELMVAPSTRMEMTREAPGMMIGGQVIDFRPFLTTISSLVLLEFRRKLFSMAQADMFSNSSVAVERWLDPTRRYVSLANLTITLHSCFGWRSEATTM